MEKNISKMIKIFIGSVIMSIGLYFFLINNDIASGGVAGISMIAAQLFPIMTTGQWSLLLNVILLVVAFFVIGVDFGLRSTLSSLVVSFSLIVLEKLFPNVILTDNIVMNIIFGAGIVAFSLAIIFFNDGSSGGTDIIAAIINKYSRLSLTISLFIIDTLVLLAAATVFGFDNALYAILAVIIQTSGFNYCIQGFGRKIAIYVISEKNDEISDMILSKFNRGVTLLQSKGGYSHADREVILTIVPFRNYIKMKDEILEVDNKAFIFTHAISEVLGEGFTFDVYD